MADHDNVTQTHGSARGRGMLLWLIPGSAVAYMIVRGWHQLLSGGLWPSAEWHGHAATARWLNDSGPLWDWNGWSGWFYGGQAVGVNYPPLGTLWLRLTDPYVGQMAAVTAIMLVLLPWSVLRISKAVGFSSGRATTAVAFVMIVLAWSPHIVLILPSFHYLHNFWGTWPQAAAIVLGLFVASHAANATRPVLAGLLLGAVALFNITIVLPTLIVCAVFLLTSKEGLKGAVRWYVIAGSVATAISGWWVVPFLSGRSRFVNSDISLGQSLTYFEGIGGPVILVLILGGGTYAAYRDSRSRRLMYAALAPAVISVPLDMLGYPRANRLLTISALLAVTAICGLGPSIRDKDRFLWAGVAALVPIGVAAALSGPSIWWNAALSALVPAMFIVRRFGTRWVIVAGAALAWCAIALYVPAWGDKWRDDRMIQADDVHAALSGHPGGLLATRSTFYSLYTGGTRDGDVCETSDIYSHAIDSQGTVSVLTGLYKETSAVSEFAQAARMVRIDERPRWKEAWVGRGRPDMASGAMSEALGARWTLLCESDSGQFRLVQHSGIRTVGSEVSFYSDSGLWHKAAVDWWVGLAAGDPAGAIPVLRPDSEDERGGAAGQLASQVSLHYDENRFFVTAASAGWVWVKIPWDPWWHEVGSGSNPLKGGPGHMAIWAREGTTEFIWAVPGRTYALAAVVSLAGGVLVASVLLFGLRRKRAAGRLSSGASGAACMQ